MWLGTWKNRRDNPGNFKWTNQKILILGIYFGNEVTPEDNWNERINKITCILCQWKRRFLTMKGKAVVVNSLVGSSVISCPDYLIKKLDDVIWDFFWSGKPDKMKRDTIRGPANMGGVGLINIGLKLRALKLQWLQKYTVQQGKWKNLFDYWIKRDSGVDNLGWFVLNNPKKYSPYTPIFYRDVINAFVQSGCRVNCIISCINEALEMPLWNNKVITVDGRKILKPASLVLLKYVFQNHNFISFQQLANKCNIKNINAGKIMSHLRKHIDSNILCEIREGPANHLSNHLQIKIDTDHEDYTDIMSNFS